MVKAELNAVVMLVIGILGMMTAVSSVDIDAINNGMNDTRCVTQDDFSINCSSNGNTALFYDGTTWYANNNDIRDVGLLEAENVQVNSLDLDNNQLSAIVSALLLDGSEGWSLRVNGGTPLFNSTPTGATLRTDSGIADFYINALAGDDAILSLGYANFRRGGICYDRSEDTIKVGWDTLTTCTASMPIEYTNTLAKEGGDTSGFVYYNPFTRHAIASGKMTTDLENNFILNETTPTNLSTFTISTGIGASLLSGQRFTFYCEDNNTVIQSGVDFINHDGIDVPCSTGEVYEYIMFSDGKAHQINWNTSSTSSGGGTSANDTDLQVFEINATDVNATNFWALENVTANEFVVLENVSFSDGRMRIYAIDTNTLAVEVNGEGFLFNSNSDLFQSSLGSGIYTFSGGYVHYQPAYAVNNDKDTGLTFPFAGGLSLDSNATENLLCTPETCFIGYNATSPNETSPLGFSVRGDMHTRTWESTYTGGSAALCVYDNGTIYADDSLTGCP